jgi:hypothetical protein
MRLKTLIAVIALTASAVAHAALQDPKWVPVTGNANQSVLIDVANLKRTDNIVSVWQWELAGAENVKFIATTKADRRMNPAGEPTKEKAEKIVLAVTEAVRKVAPKHPPLHVEYDCATDKYRSIEDSMWTEAVPGSLGADVEKWVCQPTSSAAPDVEQKRQQGEQEKAERGAELKGNLERDKEESREAEARTSSQLAAWTASIRNRIERAWIRPPSAHPGLHCELHVTQETGGVVSRVTIGDCNGDQAVRESIQQAVYRVSPLPAPPDPALFDRNLTINFNPDNIN